MSHNYAMNKALIFLMVCVIASCKHASPKEEMKQTSSMIIKALTEHDSTALNELFIDDPAIEARDIKHRKENIEAGYLLCKSFSAVDTAQFKITKMPLSKTVYEAFVEIPFVNSSTGAARGKITLRFANWWGFKKAVNIDVANFDEIDRAYNQNTNNYVGDTAVVRAGKTIMKQNDIPIQSNK